MLFLKRLSVRITSSLSNWLIIPFSVLGRVLRRATILVANIPTSLYVMILVGLLLVLNRPIPDWLVEREKEIIKKKEEELPEPYPLYPSEGR